MINLCDRVMMRKNNAEERVCAGEVGVVIFIHNDGEAVTAEFVDDYGCIVGVVTDSVDTFSRLDPGTQLRSVSEIASNTPIRIGRARPLSATTSVTSSNPVLLHV